MRSDAASNVYPLTSEFAEPDWRRLPGFRAVTPQEWHDARWQRANAASSIRILKAVFGRHLSDAMAADIQRDQVEHATMPLLVPPHMLNTMDENGLAEDPIRRYMVPAASDRDAEWPSHPLATRDPLAESAMSPVQGLTHRYPTKVLVEIVTTCPQYCGHCTRMDLVGPNTPQITKIKLAGRPRDRLMDVLAYLRATPSVRDVVVSGGDIANASIERLEWFVGELLDVPSIRDIRLASKSLIALPQHFLQPEVLAALRRLAQRARGAGVDLALHTHANHARQITPLAARAAGQLLEAGFRDVRNQGVIMRGVNDTAEDLLELCFAMLDRARIMPYYFYMCDMIPASEHWRTPLRQAQQLQHEIMGFLPGYATPRVVCDVPLAGKMWVHQVDRYDRVRGVSYWTKPYRTSIERDDAAADERSYTYYDPIDTLPAEGREWWRAEVLQRSGAR
jgi:lysine 2,3-aminomutase